MFTPTESVAGVTLLFELTNRKLLVDVAEIWKNCEEPSRLVTVRFWAGTVADDPTGAVNVNVEGLTLSDPNPGNPLEFICIGTVVIPKPLPAVGVRVSVPV